MVTVDVEHQTTVVTVTVFCTVIVETALDVITVSKVYKLNELVVGVEPVASEERDGRPVASMVVKCPRDGDVVVSIPGIPGVNVPVVSVPVVSVPVVSVPVVSVPGVNVPVVNVPVENVTNGTLDVDGDGLDSTPVLVTVVVNVELSLDVTNVVVKVVKEVVVDVVVVRVVVNGGEPGVVVGTPGVGLDWVSLVDNVLKVTIVNGTLEVVVEVVPLPLDAVVPLLGTDEDTPGGRVVDCVSVDGIVLKVTIVKGTLEVEVEVVPLTLEEVVSLLEIDVEPVTVLEVEEL